MHIYVRVCACVCVCIAGNQRTGIAFCHSVPLCTHPVHYGGLKSPRMGLLKLLDGFNVCGYRMCTVLYNSQEA